MWITHTNRKQKEYFLAKKPTKSGGNRYFFSPKNTGTLCREIPGGYEIYEHPAKGQVFLKKISERKVSDLEKKALENLAGELSEVDAFIVDASRSALSMYTSNANLKTIMGNLNHYNADRLREFMIRDSDYSTDLRFVLVDEKERVFQTERYVYRSQIDDWRPIGHPGRLDFLAKKFLPHLGKESMFELH